MTSEARTHTWCAWAACDVLSASFRKNFLQITDINKFPFKYKLAQSILRRKFPSKNKPNRLWNAKFPPYVSASEYKPLPKRAFEN